MSKRILCIYGSQLYYGHERANLEVIKLLSENDFQLCVLTNKKGINNDAQKIIENTTCIEKPILYPDWQDMRKPFKTLKVLNYLKKVFIHNIQFLKIHRHFQPDYIYISKDFPFINLIPSFLITKTKIVYRIGDAPVLQWKPFSFLWKNYIIKRTYKFICVSYYIKSKIQELNRNDNNDKVIYSYPAFRPTTTQKINYIKNNITFSYIGQVIEAKGVMKFVEAAIQICSNHDNVSFLIGGSLVYDSNFSNQIINLINASGFSERIKLLGNIDNIKEFFSKTDVSVIPSLRPEPLANTLIEAKHNSTPSIIFNSGGLPELIKNFEDGIICKDNEQESLVTAMEYYIISPHLIETQSLKAKASILDLGIDKTNFVNKWISTFK